jgi:hypothetical protein
MNNLNHNFGPNRNNTNINHIPMSNISNNYNNYGNLNNNNECIKNKNYPNKKM